MNRAETEKVYNRVADVHSLLLLIGVSFFLGCSIAFAVGAPMIVALAGAAVLAGVGVGCTLSLVLSVREDGQVIAELWTENKRCRAAEARRIEVELRLADVQQLVSDVIEGGEDDRRVRFISLLDKALRGVPDPDDRTDWRIRRRKAHVEHRDYLNFPELPRIDGPKADEL